MSKHRSGDRRQDSSCAPVSPLPVWSEWLVRLFLEGEDQEALLGDLEEMWHDLRPMSSGPRLHLWFWKEHLRSVSTIGYFGFRKLKRRIMMKEFPLNEYNRGVAIGGMILLLPASILVLGGLLQSVFGLMVINGRLDFSSLFLHPIVILGGLALALSLNVLSVLRIRYVEGKFVGVVHVSGRLLNLALIGGTVTLGFVIMLYLFAENFQIFAA